MSEGQKWVCVYKYCIRNNKLNNIMNSESEDIMPLSITMTKTNHFNSFDAFKFIEASTYLYS